MKEWVGKKVKIFVRGLSERAIVYTAEVLNVDGNFITFRDLRGDRITVNTADIIQIKEEDDSKSFYQP